MAVIKSGEPKKVAEAEQLRGVSVPLTAGAEGPAVENVIDQLIHNSNFAPGTVYEVRYRPAMNADETAQVSAVTSDAMQALPLYHRVMVGAHRAQREEAALDKNTYLVARLKAA